MHAFASLPKAVGRSTIRLSWRLCSRALEGVQAAFNGAQNGAKRVSLADLIVLGGCAGIEQAVRAGGHDVTVPFSSGPY